MGAATVVAPTARQGRFRRVVGDERLVELVRGGDEEAFEVLYDRYHAELLSFCRHMLGTREEAEDALQHVFVAAHRHLRSSDQEIRLRPWLYAIARNRCLSILRARRLSVALDEVPEPETEGLAVAAEVEQRQDLKDLLHDLTRLPDGQRAALVLSEIGALSHDEIAAALEVRTEKVKALVFQAREALLGWREARDVECRTIREQIATARGAGLRRASIRRHLDVCDSCREYREEMRKQRAALALVLPVVPSVALKRNVLRAALHGSSMGAGTITAVGGTAVVGGVATVGAGSLGSGLVAKGLAVAAIAAGVGGGGLVVGHGAGSATNEGHKGDGAAKSATRQPTPAGAGVLGRPKPAAGLHRRHRRAAVSPLNGRHPAPMPGRPATRPVGTTAPSGSGVAAPIAALPVVSGGAPTVAGDGAAATGGESPAGESPAAQHSDQPAHPEHPVHPGHPAHPDQPASPQDDGTPGLALGQDRSPPPPGQQDQQHGQQGQQDQPGHGND